MTILHSYTKSAEQGAEAIQQYFVTREPSDISTAIEKLQEQIEILQGEINEPSVQATIVTLPNMSSETLNYVISHDNAVVLYNTDYLANGPISEGKFIRVFTSDQTEDSAFILKVTVASNENLILAPVVGL